jgi:hypothetical protein
MAIALTSIGAKVSYACAKTAGTMPTEGYQLIPKITEIPEMNPTPEMLDTTSLDNTEYTTSTPGLKTLETLAFTARFTQELYDIVETMNTTYTKTALWLCIEIKGLAKACYINVEPTRLGLPAVSANSVLDVTIYFSPVGEPTWSALPKYATTT